MKRLVPPLSFLTVLLALGCILFAGSTVTAKRASGIPADALPEDLQSLEIQDQYIPVPFPEAGVIHSLDGNVVVVHRSDQTAYIGREGDTVHENDEFYTLPDSRCRLRFTNEDVVSLAPETRFSVDEYSAREEAGEKTSLFGMVKGKAMFYAMRLFRFKKVRFQVKTPTAVMGVRGTKFGAHVYWLDEKKAEAEGVRVADSGRGMSPLLAQTGGRGTPVTVAACGDGSVIVNGNTLGPGQYFNSYTGTVGYDPTILGGIEGATGGSGGGGTGGGGDDGDDGDGGGGDDGGSNELLSNITNTETGNGTAGTGGSTGEETTPEMVQYGYFAALLRHDGYPRLEDVFLTRTPNEFGTDTEHRAESLLDGDYLIWNGSYTLVTTDNKGSVIPINVTLSATQLSTGYDYLAYGKWEHVSGNGFTGSGPFSFMNHAWWLEGLATPEAAMATQTGSIAYSGEAFGTMYYGGTLKDLGGSFSTMANFDSAALENFTMSLTGAGGHSVTVSGAGGDIDPDGTFDLSGGTWAATNSVGVVTVNHHEGHGRFFGPEADEIGGDWALEGSDSTNNVGAVGIFGGKRSQ